MKEYRIKKFRDLHDLLESSNRLTIYRGQSDADWELVPKAGREPFNKVSDKSAIEYFKDN